MGAAATFTALGLEEMDAELAALSGDDYVDYLRGFQESTLAQPIPAELLDLVVIDFSSDLGSISAPTLIVWGDRDAICPRSQQGALLRAIPGARLSVRAGADHAMHWEQPPALRRGACGVLRRGLTRPTPRRIAGASVRLT